MTGGSSCDSNTKWTGWYRLLYNGMSVRMPDSCVNRSRCGTYYTLWLNGSHPQIEDGIVTRGVCGNSGSDCCYYRSIPIRVKACPGNYYVYEFVRPVNCNSAYCADVSTITSVSTTTTTTTTATMAVSTYWTTNSWTTVTSPAPQTTVQTITMPQECQGNISAKCADDIFKQIENSTNPVLPPQVVEKMLQEQVLKVEVINAQVPVSAGITMLNKTEILVSTLVMPTETNSSVKISLNGLDVHVFTVGPKASLTEIPRLSINNAQMVIDLIQISKNNNGSAAVAFMSYTNISSILKPTFFNTTNKTEKTMMSNVVSATLPKTTNTQLTKPVNFTLKHIADIDPNGTLTCVYWNNTEWIIHGCILLQTNSSHTVCSCDHLSTFALIMQTNPPTVDNSDPVTDLFNTVAVAVGLFFLSLTLLTFAFCRRNPRVTNTALTNLCISLLLAHLLFLLTQTFLQYIQPQQLLCAVLAGVLHFLFLSAFVWMFIEAVLLFIAVKNLTKIRSKQKEVLSWKYLIAIGYVIPLTVVGVSVGLFPDGYGSKECWLKTDKGFLWSFLGPICFILSANMILFFVILFIVISTLKSMKSELLRIRQAKSDQRLFKSVILKTMVQFYIVGCSWILGFFPNYNKVLDMLFLFFNSQQGTFIFLIHCALNQEVRQFYIKRWRDLRAAFKPCTRENVDTPISTS
ncbi:adhesion G protein-coupled receptor E3-like [Colossoma macropomum]|uniref:adhesion G protein-coupled receptor E3-like n=1 Tax=Colossoma macropomum TaxID=42526 RepID=UPI001863B410|nr:adhesion G protein-coupled receptor E3-like [Colossoma macropomum]